MAAPPTCLSAVLFPQPQGCELIEELCDLLATFLDLSGLFRGHAEVGGTVERLVLQFEKAIDFALELFQRRVFRRVVHGAD